MQLSQVVTLVGIQEMVTVKLFIESQWFVNGYLLRWTIKAVYRKEKLDTGIVNLSVGFL